MKNILLFAGFFLSIGLPMVACNKSTTEDDGEQTVALNTCREQVNGLPGTRICLDSVVADARCPKNVQCFWQGYAIVKVNFKENGNTHLFRMSLWATSFVLQQFNAVHDTTINGYKVVFTELSETNKSPSEVKAIFKVSR